MTFFHNLLRTLVEKRLWPVALLLVVAIVAIPVIGGAGGGGAVADKADLPIAPTNAVSGKPTVDLVGPPTVRKRPGRLVDPFRRTAEQDESAAASPAGSGEGSAGSGESPAGEGAAGGTAPSRDETTTSPVEGGSSTQKQTRTPSVYRTTVRWSSSAPPKARELARLTPLGGLTHPALQYLGVASNGRHALFLLGPAATSTGEAGCPDPECRVLALAKGESQIVEVQPVGVAPSRFKLELVSVKRDELSSAAAARKAYAEEHPDGRDLLRSLIKHRPTADTLGRYAYDRAEGIMVRAGDESARETE